MAFYPRAAVIKRQHEWDGQSIEFQITMSPLNPVNWQTGWLDGIATALYDYIGAEVTPLNPTSWGGIIDDATPTTVLQKSCEIYLMQGGFNSLFFRKVFPMNVFGQRVVTGDIAPSFVAGGYSSATTEYQKKPADFRFGPVLESDIANNEFVGGVLSFFEPLADVLNQVVEVEAAVFEESGVPSLYLSEWVTSVVTRLKIEDPDNPGTFDYVLPSQPGDPVFATRVTNWAFQRNVTSQISRKRRKNNA